MIFDIISDLEFSASNLNIRGVFEIVYYPQRLIRRSRTLCVITKFQVPNPKIFFVIGLIFVYYFVMGTHPNRIYDLDKRTFIFAQNVREYVNKLPKKVTNTEIGRQLMRSAGSVGANYIEADEALSKKDFIMRIKICRKEAKENKYWIELNSPKTKYIQLKTPYLYFGHRKTKYDYLT